MDFKEYSAAFHAQNDDIMHYGVKGMKWDPSKKKKTSSDEDKASEQRKNAAKTATVATSAGLGPAILKGIYDNLPKKTNSIKPNALNKSSLTAKNGVTATRLASGGGKRIGSGRGKYADSHPDELVADTKKKKKKNRGRMPRGRYSERG